MNKKVVKPVVLVLVFLVSLIGFSFLTDKKQMNLTTEMEEATLPIVYLQKENIQINELFGYKNEMDAMSMRDTITPLSEDMILPVTVQAFQNHIEGISYEVRTMDMERLLEKKQISGYNQKDGVISTEIQLQNLLEEEQEYRLIIILETNGEEIYYYTRVICAEDCYVDESIAFTLDFHKRSFDAMTSAGLATYLEPNSEGDNTTLQTVTIHSALKQVAWGAFEGQVLKDPIPSVKEIGSSYNAIVLNYVVAATGDNGETEFYNVEEYYRVRYSTINNRIYLLDYERTMNEIFRGSGANFTDTALLLGIRDKNISYMANENATIIGFVQEGDLWSYNSSNHQLSLVFSFRGIEGVSDRENHQDYDMRIIRVNESGSMDFVVYGYMNRGEHEGCTGIGVYHYDSIANTIQEELFVQSDESYQLLKESWGKLFYTSGAGSFYMIAEESLYRIQLGNGQAELVQEGLTEGNFAVSDNGRYVAWCVENRRNTIVVMDLETEEQRQITGSAEEILQPIGFVESDFVYGIAKAGEESNSDILLHKIVIVDNQQQVLKEYEKSGYYIADAYVEDDTIFMERVKKSGSAYVAVEPDAIKSHEIEASRNVHIDTLITNQKQTQILLKADFDISGKAPRILTPKEVVVDEKQVISLISEKKDGSYCVWRGGEVLFRTSKVSEAVQYADAVAGVVVEDGQNYIWRRGGVTSISMANKVILSQEEINIVNGPMARCLTAILQAETTTFDVGGLVRAGETAEHILQQAMPAARVLNLDGCSLSQTLYYVGLGNLVFALGEDQQPLLIVGYDERNVVLYSPETNSTYRKTIQEAEESFAGAGNVFISYLKE